MTTQDETRHPLIKGPRKFDWITKFGQGEPVELSNGTDTFVFVLTGLDWEDGSGHSWIFRATLISSTLNYETKGMKVHGYWSTSRGRGSILVPIPFVPVRREVPEFIDGVSTV